MAAVVILIGSVGFPSEGLGSATTRSASETALPDPFLPNANPWNLGYVSPGELLVFSAGLQSVTVPEPYWVWRLGPEGQLLGGWGPTGFPEPSTWVPETMAVDRTRRRVYFWASTAINRRRGPLVVFDTDRRYLDTWRWPYGMVGLSTWLRVAPDGSVYAVLSLPANPSSTHVDRWSTNGNFLGRWPGSLGTRQYGVHDFFVDETGRVVLIGPADTLQRFNPDGEAIDVLRLPHPPAIGPAILGNDIWVTGVDADHASASIVLTTSRSMQANHLARYSSEGTFQSSVPLWRYHQLQEPTHQAVAAGPDGLVALDWDPHSRIQPRPVRRAAITQWSSEVTIRSVTVFSGPHSQLEQTWARARVSGGGVQHLLYPESAVIAQLDPEGHIIRQRVAPPFAMDIAADDDGYLAIRGWDGQHSRLSLWDPNQSTLWATDCPISLATGLAIDRRFVYVSDPVRRVVLAFRRADGQAVGSLGPAHASAGWPLDLAALSPGTLATLGQHGEIEIWTWQAGRVEPGASFRTHSSLPPLAMAATATSLAVLVSDRSIELFAPDGTLRDRWWLGPDRQPVDLTFLSPSTLLILDAARPSLVAYRVPDPSLPELGQPDVGAGICQLTGDKLADPTRVAVGQPVTITLTLAAYCPPGPSLVNVVIVWSPKSSFWYRYDFARARELILWLVEALDRPPFRVAVVTVRPNTPAGVLEAEVGVPFDTPLPQALERLAGIAL